MGGQERVGKGRQDEADTVLATLTSAEAITDPYPLYEEMRKMGRIITNPFLAGQ